jgi:putative DNA primase/helicase
MAKREPGTAKRLGEGKWKQLLPELGVPANVLDGKHHPCPATGKGEDRFRFVDRNGSGNFFCRCSDGTKGAMALAMCCSGKDFAEIARDVEEKAGGIEIPKDSPRAERDPRIALRKAKAAISKSREHVERYLAGRLLTPAPGCLQARMPYYVDGKKVAMYDAMLCVFSNKEGKPISFHVTYLEDGKKIERGADPSRKIMTPTEPLMGGAIRICPPAEIMGVSEGVENALSSTELYNMPVWPCATEGLLAAFVPPKEVRELWVFGDNDTSFAGQASAYALARRMVRMGLRCYVVLPNLPGQDFNDVLKDSKA